MWDRQPIAPDHHEDEAYDPYESTPMGHICSTYNLVDPQPGECRGRKDVPLYCFEHREWHMVGDIHAECEACEWERNHPGVVLDDDELVERFESGAVCDGHLVEEMYEDEE
jgi:hypothetical protein